APNRTATPPQGVDRRTAAVQPVRGLLRESLNEGVFMQNIATRPAREVALWVPGDWNAFFGLFTNVLLNVLVLTGLVLGVVKLPNDIVFGRILPALGFDL